jgi:plasmid stabilization system protein ParE
MPGLLWPIVVLDVLEIASIELRHAAVEYEGHREGYGTRFLDEVFEVFDAIGRMPQLGSPWLLEGVPQGTRHVPLRTFPYNIVYVTDPRTVVVAVMHGHQQPLYWLDRLDDVK